MNFHPYPKIHRLGKEETDGILDFPVTVQEKIDGANISIWLDNGTVKCGSRTRELPLDESFNGFQETVNNNTLIRQWLIDHPQCRLYGEWLVKHTITYPDTAYRKIYLFDILDDGNLYPQEYVQLAAESMLLEYPTVFLKDVMITDIEKIKESFVGKSGITDAANGEGIVIKSLEFINKFGDPCYAKLVHEKFKEANAIVFGGNNKHSDSYEEMYIVNKYCTLGRVQKIMMKLQATSERRLDMENTSEIAGRCLHDMIIEECWEIFNMGKVLNNRKLKGLATRKFIQLYHDILGNSISIADGGIDGHKGSGDIILDADIGEDG